MLAKYFLLALLLFPFHSFAQEVLPCQQAFIDGYKAYKTGRIEKAKELFLGAKGKCPVAEKYIDRYLDKIKNNNSFVYYNTGNDAESQPLEDIELAKFYFREKKYAEAEKLFREIAESDKKSRLDALEYLAISLGRQDKYDEAILTYQKIIDEYSHIKSMTAKAMYKVGFLLMDAGRYGEAKEQFFKLQKKFLSHKPPQVAWNLAWCAYKLGEFDEAIKKFSELENKKDMEERAAYWRAMALAMIGEEDEANEIYQELSEKYPKNYYGMMAMQRVGEKGTGYFLHFERSREEKVACPLFLNLAKENDIWWLVYDFEPYPKAYPKIIEGLSKKYKLDPDFIMAIMREESTFRDDAVSRSGAIGLMQLMPATAEKFLVSKDVAKNYPLEPEKLLAPEINIKAGVRYLDFLQKRYHGNLFYIAAAYNAGEEAVDRWIKKKNPPNPPLLKGGENDIPPFVKGGEGGFDLEFVEEIPYKETQEYVRKVMKSYWIYKKN